MSVVNYAAVNNHAGAYDADTASPVALEDRLGKLNSLTGKVNGPAFDVFYQDFMTQFAQSELSPSAAEIKDFLKDYRGEGDKKMFSTSGKQTEVLADLMVRMKRDGLESDELYKSVRACSVAVSATKMLVEEFMVEVFKAPDDEDDRANSNW